MGRSKIASVAPRRLSASPNRTIPETVKSPVPVGVTTRIRFPTDSWWVAAEAASTATWSGPDGAVPEITLRLVTSGSHEFPIVGAPPFWITLPVTGSTIWAKPAMSPSAPLTPGIARTAGRTLSGIGLRSLPPPPPPPPAAPGAKAVFACTTTSVPRYTLPNRSSKLFSAVSVRTNVPAVNPTPSTTAIAVSSSRSLRASRLFTAARSTRDQPSIAFRCSRTRSAVGSSISSTTRPSARNTIRSAYEAATHHRTPPPEF